MFVLGFLLPSLSRCIVYIKLVLFVCLNTVAVSLKFSKDGLTILVDQNQDLFSHFLVHIVSFSAAHGPKRQQLCFTCIGFSSV